MQKTKEDLKKSKELSDWENEGGKCIKAKTNSSQREENNLFKKVKKIFKKKKKTN